MGKDLTQWLGLGLAAAIVVMLMVVCIAGVISSSSFGIFFADTSSSTEQTLRTAVQEIEAEYRGQLADIRTATPHDVLEETGTDPSWPEVLALYAVETTTDPTAPEEVTTYVPVPVTQQVLIVTVAHKSVDEMAVAFGFTPAQRLQLTELLSEQMSGIWTQMK